MNLLKRNLAPLTEEAWEEIDDRAAEVLKACLSARRVVHVNGPMGLDYTAVPEGRLVDISGNDGDVQSGIYKIQPLTEARISFSLDLKELDNLQRGAKDIDFEPLEEATRKMALLKIMLYIMVWKWTIKGIINSAIVRRFFGMKEKVSWMLSLKVVFACKMLLLQNLIHWSLGKRHYN